MEKTVEEKRVYTGNLISVNADRVSLPTGKKTFREYVSHPGAVAAIPFLTQERIILVRQYRYAVKKDLLEIPAGKIEEGESPEETITRELQEEIHYIPEKLEKIGWFYPSPGYTNEKICLFKAFNLKPKSLQTEEKIEVVQMEFKEVLNSIRRGEIRDGKTIIALLSCIH